MRRLSLGLLSPVSALWAAFLGSVPQFDIDQSGRNAFNNFSKCQMGKEQGVPGTAVTNKFLSNFRVLG